MLLHLSANLRVLTLLLTTVTALPHHTQHQLATKDDVVLPRLDRRASKQDYVAYANAGINQMQTWYDAATGLWDEAWWPSANVITMLADFQEHFPSIVQPTTHFVFPNTLAKAPSYNGYTGFINGFYDDELWWVLAWIKVFDVTGESQYLDIAKNSWGESPCGGLW
jgi:hypothetical protein